MRFDLKEPCKHCPFRTDDTRITFRGRERAEEIKERAYRQGFPCHLSAECDEDPFTGEETYVFGDDTQHCAGYILLQLRDGAGMPWPGIGNDEDRADRLAQQLDWNAPVFESVEEFLEANAEPKTEQVTEPRLRADGRHPGPRYREQGACSGEEFRDDVLIPRVREAAARGQTLSVELEDAEFGYPCGWLEEVFGGLVRKMPGITPAQVTPVSTNHPDAAAEAIAYMREAELHAARSGT